MIFDRWGNQIYIDLLGRRPSASERANLGALYAAGMTRPQILTWIIRDSECQQRLLTGFYSRLLRRNPTDAERSAAMKGYPPVLEGDPTLLRILTSPEYFVLAGGTNAGWINRIFNDVLGRAPSASDLHDLSPIVDTPGLIIGTSTSLSVAAGILNSSEAINGRVQEYYMRFLHRSPSPAEINGGRWVMPDDWPLIAMLLGSDEYFNFGTLLLIDEPGSGLPDNRYWVEATNACGSTASDTAVLTIPQCTAPVIATQPQNVTVNAGTQASVAVLASVATAYQYQWYRGGSGDPSNPINGAIGPVLTMTPTLGGSTQYWVKLWNACGSANSNTLTITALQQRRRPTSR